MQICINGINTNYIDTGGERETVVMLHGWGADISSFVYLINDLRAHFRVIAPDMPGFGGSAEPERPYELDEYIAFVDEFLKNLGVQKAHFIGHSFGGRIIIKAAANGGISCEFDKIILFDAAGIKPKQSARQKLSVAFFKTAKKLFSLDIMQKMYPGFIESLRAKMGSADYNAASPVIRATLVKVINEDLTKYLPMIANQTLLVWGELDDATPLSDGKLMEKLIKDSALITIEGAGHYSFLDNRSLCAAAAVSFLTGGKA